jgi:hypothetical protein
MFRQVLSILFLLAFAVQTFQQNLIVGSYYINNALYAKNCENKTKPSLGCKGKCQMMKKLQEEEQKQAPAPGMKAEQKGETFSSQVYTTVLTIPETGVNGCFNFAFTIGTPANISLSIFHPPSFA